MSELGNLWDQLALFDPKQMLGIAQEREEYNEYSSWYHKPSINHPFVRPHGVNSGVLLMNLTRMRDFSFVQKIALIHEQYKERIVWFDQDVINILGYFNPGFWQFSSCFCLDSQ